MSTLRDQLLKAKLVDKKQARQAEIEVKQKERLAYKARKSGLVIGPTAEEVAAKDAKEERERQAERSRELNRALDDEKAGKALRAEIRHMIQTSAEPQGKGDIRYHFADGTAIKKLYVDQGQQKALAKGLLAVIGWEGAYYLVPSETAEKIKQRRPDTFVFVAEPEGAGSDPDDPYAAFPIPDDLTW